MRTMIAGVALVALLAGCEAKDAAVAPVESADGNSAKDADAALCGTVVGATTNGNESMRATFVSTPEGRDYGGGVIAELMKQNGYSFLGTEMVGNTCYAYAQAHGEQWGKTFKLDWRCPVKMLGNSPSEAGKTMVELVDDKLCDLSAERGAPLRQPVEVELMHL